VPEAHAWEELDPDDSGRSVSDPEAADEEAAGGPARQSSAVLQSSDSSAAEPELVTTASKEHRMSTLILRAPSGSAVENLRPQPLTAQ